jgi:hypothetical protein
VQAAEIYFAYTDRLEALDLSYVVTGSVASSVYGEPRFTHDIDLMLLLPAGAIDRLWNAFPGDEFYCPPVETIREEAGRSGSGHFNLIHHESGFRADVYVVDADGLTGWALEKHRVVELVPGRTLRVAPPEYVILSKLEFHAEGGGEKHLRDIRAMLELGEDDIDVSFIEEWVRRLGVESAWQSVRPD